MKAILCCRPYQLFNAINYTMNVNSDVEGVDIFIGLRFNNAESIAKKLNEMGIFHNVYTYKRGYFSSLAIKRCIEKLSDIFLPRQVIQKCVLENEVIQFKRYKEIVLFSFNPFSMCFLNYCRRINNDLKTVLVEEGLFIYDRVGNNTFGGKEYKIRAKLFKQEKYDFNEVYVYKPALIEDNSLYGEIKQLPHIKNGDFTHRVLKEVFSENEYIYEGYKVIILSQYPFTGDRYEVEKTAYNILARHFGEDSIGVKLHPSDSGVHTEYRNAFSDPNAWELTVLNTDMNKKILVSINSSAIITPKLIYDKECVCILLFKLLTHNPTKIEYDYFTKIIETYRDKEKVYIPETWDEMERVTMMLKGS